jgi:hypothetical protein
MVTKKNILSGGIYRVLLPSQYSEKSGPDEQGAQTAEKFRVEMKIICDEVPDHREKIVAYLNVLLPANMTKLANHFGATIQAVCFLAVLFMTHGKIWGFRQRVREQLKLL